MTGRLGTFSEIRGQLAKEKRTEAKQNGLSCIRMTVIMIFYKSYHTTPTYHYSIRNIIVMQSYGRSHTRRVPMRRDLQILSIPVRLRFHIDTSMAVPGCFKDDSTSPWKSEKLDPSLPPPKKKQN